jgi:hypothetical protein
VAMGSPRTPLAVARWENEGGAVKHEAPSGPRRGPSPDDGQAWRDPDSVPARESSSNSPTSGHELGRGQGGGANEQDSAEPQVGRRADAREGETRAPRLR